MVAQRSSGLRGGCSYTVEVGVCFLVLCDKNYIKLLAFSYLADLQKEFFEVFTHSDVQSALRPYECIKFGTPGPPSHPTAAQILSRSRFRAPGRAD